MGITTIHEIRKEVVRITKILEEGAEAPLPKKDDPHRKIAEGKMQAYSHAYFEILALLEKLT